MLSRRRLGLIAVVAALVAASTCLAWFTRSDLLSRRPTGAPSAESNGVVDLPSILGGLEDAGSSRQVAGPQAEAGGELVGSLLFLRQDTLEPSTARSWVFARDDGPEQTLQRELDLNGRCTLPSGVWRIRPLAKELTPIPGTIALRAGASATIWVAPEAGLDLFVSDTWGLPIGGAQVRFYPSASGHVLLTDPPFWTVLPTAEATTDATGFARLVVTGSQVGDLYVMHPKHQLGSWRLCYFPGRPLRVCLQPAGNEGRELQLTASDDDLPLPGLSVLTKAGPVDGVTDPAGRISLPPWAAGAQPLVVTGPGVCRAELPLDLEAPHQVRIARSTRVSVRVSDPLATGREEVRLFLTALDEDPQATAKVLLENQLRAPSSGQIEVDIPRMGRTRIAALTSVGSSASQDVSPDVPRLEVTLALESESLLAVSAQDEVGAAVASFQAISTYDRVDEIAFDSDPNGIVLVPMPDQVDELRITCPGYSTVHLDAHPRSNVSREGRLRVVLARAHQITLEVTDSQGRPRPGYLVSVSDQRRFQAYRDHPDLGGAWPTAHPGWIQEAAPDVPWDAAWTTTDSEGRVRIRGLARGEYKISAQLHPSLLQAYTQAFVSEERRTVVVPVHEEVLPWRIAELRRVTVEATLGNSDSPVDGLSIRSPDSDPGLLHRAAGNLWQGWVQVGKSLDVSSEGLAPSTVVVEEGEDEFYARIALWPDRARRILLSGDLEGLSGSVLRYIVRGPPAGRLLDPPIIGRGVLAFADASEPTDVFLPYGQEATVSLEQISYHGSTWTFTPSSRALSDGPDLHFVASRQPGD